MSNVGSPPNVTCTSGSQHNQGQESHTNTIDLNVSAGIGSPMAPLAIPSVGQSGHSPNSRRSERGAGGGVGAVAGLASTSIQSERNGNGLVKMLIPAYAAGSVIGKQGATITSLQKSTGINIKLSKPKDYYPGTLERVALIQGKTDTNGVNEVVRFIINKVIDFPIPKELVMTNSERPKQVKIIVPNSTAGLIIGKKGGTIKHIMETSQAKVQMTQKPDGLHMQPLLERVITICGERDQLHEAVNIILEKIKDDPQSASCPNLSYQNVTGLIANASPVGSPYAPVNRNQLLSAVNVNLVNAAAASQVSAAAQAQAQTTHQALSAGAAIPAHTLNLISNGGALPLNSAIQNLNLSASLGNQSQIYTVFP